MKKLTKPGEISYDVYLKCIENTTKNKDYYLSIADIILTSEEDYLQNAADRLHQIQSKKHEVGYLEMTYLYDSKMVNKVGPARDIYDRIKLAPAHGVCPFCNQRIVSTLDHYLTKKEFPEFTLAPINLVPSCRDCNSAKLTSNPTSPEDHLFHPYFDDFGSDIWLEASIRHSIPTSLLYYVARPLSWNDIQFNRTKNHFNKLNLNELYSAHAAQEIENIKFHLKELLSSAGSSMVKNHLNDQANSYGRNDINSWQSAMYRCLANDDYFTENLHSL